MKDNTINFEFIVTMMQMLPKRYDTNTVKIARGRFKKPTTLKERVKKFING